MLLARVKVSTPCHWCCESHPLYLFVAQELKGSYLDGVADGFILKEGGATHQEVSFHLPSRCAFTWRLCLIANMKFCSATNHAIVIVHSYLENSLQCTPVSASIEDDLGLGFRV